MFSFAKNSLTLSSVLEDGSIGSVDALVTLYADKFFTYEKDVSTALLSLWQRQTRSNSVCENTFPQVCNPSRNRIIINKLINK